MLKAELAQYAEPRVDGMTESEIQQKYKKGTLVSVYLGGRWRIARVEAASIDGGKLKASVRLPSSEKVLGQARNTDRERDNPDVTEPRPGDNFEDFLEDDEDDPFHRFIASDIAEHEREMERMLNEDDDEDEVSRARSRRASSENTADPEPQDADDSLYGLPRDIVLEHLPQKIEFTPDPDLDFDNPDPQSSVDFFKESNPSSDPNTSATENAASEADRSVLLIKDVRLDRDGSVTYDLARRDGKEFASIPQELLVLWKNVLELERNLEEQNSKIEKDITVHFRSDLHERSRNIKNMLLEASAALPKVDKISAKSNEEVNVIANKLSILKNKAEDAIRELEHYVKRAQEDSEKIVPLYFETRSEIEARKEQAKREYAEHKKFLDEFERNLETEYAKAVKKIDEEEKKDLEKAVAKAKKAHEEKHKPKGQGDKGDKNKAPAFDESTVSLTDDEKEVFEKLREEAKEEVLFGALEKIKQRVASGRTGNIIELDFFHEMVDRRKDMAANDVVVNDSEYTPDMQDYTPGDLGSVYADKTIAAYRETVSDWKSKMEGGMQEGGVDMENKENVKPFDFDDLEYLGQDMKLLQHDIPLVPGTGEPKEQYKKIYDALKEMARDADQDHRFWSQPVEKVREKLAQDPTVMSALAAAAPENYSQTMEGALRIKREEVYSSHLRKFNELRAEFEVELTKEALAKERGKMRETEKQGTFVDIPEAVLREKLFTDQGRLGKFRDAMHILYKDAFAKPGALGPDALAALQQMIPSSPDKNLLEAFSQYGVKNWEDFKKMWDTHIAKQFGEVLRVSAEANIKTKIAEKVSWYKKAWKLKGDITIRILTTGLVLGGASFGAGALAAAYGAGALVTGVATVGGGAVGGGFRGALHKLIFGSDRAKQKMAEKMQDLNIEVAQENQNTIINELLDGNFGGSAGGVDFEQASIQIDQLPQLTAIMSETVRQVSSVLDKQPGEVGNLSAEARTMYEQALATLEPQERTEKVKRDLAIALSQMSANGSKLEKATYDRLDSRVIKFFDAMFSDIGGEKGVMRGAVTGAALAGAFMIDNMWARGALGAMGGARIGYKMGREKEMAVSRKEARELVLKDLKEMKDGFDNYALGLAKGDSGVEGPELEDLKRQLIAYKKLLRGNMQEEYAHAFYVDEEADTYGKDQIDRDNLVAQIRVAVHDAELTGILMTPDEEKVGAERMQHMLDQARQSKREVEEVNPRVQRVIEKRLRERWDVKTGIYTIVGGWLGAAASLGLGEVMQAARRPVTEWMREKFGSDNNVSELIKDSVLPPRVPPEAVPDPNLPPPVRLEDVPNPPMRARSAGAVDGRGAADMARPGSPGADYGTPRVSPDAVPDPNFPPPVRLEDVPDPPASPEDVRVESRMGGSGNEDVFRREIPINAELPKEGSFVLATEKSNVANTKMFNNTDNLLDRYSQKSRYSVIGKELNTANMSAEQRQAWEEMQDDFDDWKSEQLKDMGYRMVGGRQGHPISLRKGDEMKIMWDDKTNKWRAGYERYAYDKHGKLLYETNDDGSAKLDKNGNKIPIDKFKGRVHKNLKFLDEGGKGKLVKPEDVPMPENKNNELLRNLKHTDPEHQKQVEHQKHQDAERAKLAEQVRQRMEKQYNPYADPEFEPGGELDGYARMPADDAKHGAPTESLALLRQAPEVFDMIDYTGDPDVAADDLQKFTDEYVRSNAPDPSSKPDVEAFRSAWREHLAGVEPAPEVARPADSKMFLEDYMGEIDDDDFADDEDDDNVVPVDFAGRGRAMFATGEDGLWDGKNWAAKFTRSGSSIIGMEMRGWSVSVPDLLSQPVLDLDDPFTKAAITSDAEKARIFGDIGKYDQVLESMAQGKQLNTMEGQFVKNAIKENIEELSKSLNLAPEDLFKRSFLEKVGMTSGVAKAA